MLKKPTIYFVVDIETTYKRRIAFDIAWLAIDKHGNTHDKTGKRYGKGSYVIRKAFEMDVPFYREKLGMYFDDVYSHLITPADIHDVRSEFNSQIAKLEDNGHKVVLCAYNAQFDFTYLPKTYQILTEYIGETWLDKMVPLMDIWHFWGESVPLCYDAEVTDSQRFLKTSAEAAFRFEQGDPNFIERHIAFSDCIIEAAILVKALSRRKKQPLVYSPKDFKGNIYKLINNRLGIDGKTILYHKIQA